jgi:glutamine synthetase
MHMKPKDVVELAKTNQAVMIDLKFMDFPGRWQHFSVPVTQLTVESFEHGFGFDGSSLRGWQPINASDMLVVPDPKTAVMDPMMGHPTLSLICDIVDPVTREAYSRDPRNIARKAESYLKQSGIADTAFVGPEAEFFIFDEVRFEQAENGGFYEVDSSEGAWNTGRDEGPNLGHKPGFKGGYFPVPPSDSLQDLRTEMCIELQKVGLIVEAQHHEVATGGQCEIDVRFAPLLQAADNMMWLKYIIKNVARRAGRTVTFMPKPLYGDNGSGMHCHMSLWKEGKPLFAGNGYAGMSQEALWFIGGILRHAQAVCALTCPTTNSYRRLVPGFEAPVNLAYSSRNRSAAVRLPLGSDSPNSRRVEIRFPDPSSNGYLAFSALLMAGLDGIERRLDPGRALEKDIYGMSPEELKDVPSTPPSLEAALHALEKDHDFLQKGDVFTNDAIERWIETKLEHEAKPASMIPTPIEFKMYYDI